MALVIKSWTATETPGADGIYVSIVGRQEGFFSWLLSVLGIDATTTLRVDRDTVYFEAGSLAGFQQRVIPLANLSSAYFGYAKPWQVAVAIGVALGGFFGLGIVLGLLYYFLNKTLSLGIIENSGVLSGIEFKRSVIEGQNINEQEGRRVCNIVKHLMMEAQGRPQPQLSRASNIASLPHTGT
ncbi:hypothetical protein BO221_16355 [Archangium sp. Cb G35]|uniref:hypothetical protein n=1 Tax=Archangium sp. Cb G35 TaxID=1920190 RepID=UPI0009362471|nr:hypothetical protein [Archangium sp. Cb G35]OJT23957.1 hypothetical protein BO221_16355 [Archangium sp. Cb G35]